MSLNSIQYAQSRKNRLILGIVIFIGAWCFCSAPILAEFLAEDLPILLTMNETRGNIPAAQSKFDNIMAEIHNIAMGTFIQQSTSEPSISWFYPRCVTLTGDFIFGSSTEFESILREMSSEFEERGWFRPRSNDNANNTLYARNADETVSVSIVEVLYVEAQNTEPDPTYYKIHLIYGDRGVESCYG